MAADMLGLLQGRDVETVYSAAQRLRFTKQGEMFSGNFISANSLNLAIEVGMALLCSLYKYDVMYMYMYLLCYLLM